MVIFSSSLTHEEYEFILMGVILIDLISFYSFFKNWKRLRFIEDTPTARLRSSHQGYVEIEGKGAMIADKPIYAPLIIPAYGIGVRLNVRKFLSRKNNHKSIGM